MIVKKSSLTGLSYKGGVPNHVIKIDEKHGLIVVEANDKVLAEKLAYRTYIFSQPHECEVIDIFKQSDGTYSVFYVTYMDYDFSH